MTMDATFTWTAVIDCAPSQDGLSNVVKTVHWRCTGKLNGHDLALAGDTILGDPDPDNFVIAPDEVTSDVIRAWVGEADASAAEMALAARLSNAADEPVLIMLEVPVSDEP